MYRIEGIGNTDSYEKKYSALSLEHPHLFEAPTTPSCRALHSPLSARIAIEATL